MHNNLNHPSNNGMSYSDKRKSQFSNPKTFRGGKPFMIDFDSKEESSLVSESLTSEDSYVIKVNQSEATITEGRHRSVPNYARQRTRSADMTDRVPPQRQSKRKSSQFVLHTSPLGIYFGV